MVFEDYIYIRRPQKKWKYVKLFSLRGTRVKMTLYYTSRVKGTAWENKKLCLFALIIGVKEHPAYGGWPRPCRCLHVIPGPFGPAKDMLWTIRVPEEQISCCKCCPGFWFFFKNFFLQFLEMRVCVSVMEAFFLNMKFVLNK